jgi:UDP-2,3-diacylglucosamine pyrophosphatase LpxH
MLGHTAYDWLLYLNRIFNQFRRACGFPYWSLAAFIKQKVKNAVKFISDFEHAVVREARKRKVDGLVCGHIHHAEITSFDDVLYCNCGDWVESHTALIEGFDGSLQLMYWSERKLTVKDVSTKRLTADVATDNAA